MYLEQIVWPDARLLAADTSSPHFTLPAGSYVFPFRLQLPLQNACNSHVNHSSVPIHHVTEALPPSFSGGIRGSIQYLPYFSIRLMNRYFVKVKVCRHSLFQKDLRRVVPFSFWPTELPRLPSEISQTFVCRKHMFASSKKGTGVNTIRKSTMQTTDAGDITFEARLPNPPILIPSQSIPLTIILKKREGLSSYSVRSINRDYSRYYNNLPKSWAPTRYQVYIPYSIQNKIKP